MRMTNLRRAPRVARAGAGGGLRPRPRRGPEGHPRLPPNRPKKRPPPKGGEGVPHERKPKQPLQSRPRHLRVAVPPRKVAEGGGPESNCRCNFRARVQTVPQLRRHGICPPQKKGFVLLVMNVDVRPLSLEGKTTGVFLYRQTDPIYARARTAFCEQRQQVPDRDIVYCTRPSLHWKIGGESYSSILRAAALDSSYHYMCS